MNKDFSTSKISKSFSLSSLLSFGRWSFNPEANSLVIETTCQPFALANSVTASTCEAMAALFSDEDWRAYMAQRILTGDELSPASCSTHEAGMNTLPVVVLMEGAMPEYTQRRNDPTFILRR